MQVHSCPRVSAHRSLPQHLQQQHSLAQLCVRQTAQVKLKVTFRAVFSKFYAFEHISTSIKVYLEISLGFLEICIDASFVGKNDQYTSDIILLPRPGQTLHK